jgi:hypothetical protein
MKKLQSWRDTAPFNKVVIVTVGLWLLVNVMSLIGIL